MAHRPARAAQRASQPGSYLPARTRANAARAAPGTGNLVLDSWTTLASSYDYGASLRLLVECGRGV